ETLRATDAAGARRGREERICHLLDQRGEINEVILYEAASWLGLPLNDADLCGHGFLDRCVVAAPVPYLTPSEQLAHFQLPAGYRLELVVGDPIIKEPVAIAFDGNGRMFVAEMRAFMQDLEGTDQRAKTGRVSLHWSSQGDGVFDRHSVFIDGLVLPRMILPLADGLLVGET